MRAADPDGLSHFERLFVSGVIKHGNLARAYREAGYTGKYSDTRGTRVRAIPRVDAAIKRALAKVDQKAIADSQEIQERLTGFLRDDGAETQDRIRAARELGKIQKLYSDKIEFTGKVEHEHTHSVAMPTREEAMRAFQDELRANPELRKMMRLMLDQLDREANALEVQAVPALEAG